MTWSNTDKQRLHEFMQLVFPYGVVNTNSYLNDDCMVWYFNNDHKVTLDFETSSITYDNSPDNYRIECESYTQTLDWIVRFAKMSNLEYVFYA